MMQQDKGYSVFLPQFVYITGNKSLFKEENDYFHFENITQFVLYEKERENKHGYELFLLKRNDGHFIELALDAAPNLSMYSKHQASEISLQIQDCKEGLVRDVWGEIVVPHEVLQRISKDVKLLVEPQSKETGQIYNKRNH